MGIREGIREFFGSKDDFDYPDSYERYRMFSSPHGRNGHVPVLEMRVPLCCDSCEKKVREAVEDCAGVEDVHCDRENSRVTVTGFVDPLKALRKVKKVKPKSDLHGANTYIDKRTSIPVETTRYVTNPLIRSRYSTDFDRYPSDSAKVHYARANPNDRRVRRLPSFSRVERYDDRHHHALVPLDLQRDYYGIRRMPSFDRHRYHDAEYVSMGNEFTPSIPETRYVSLYSKRPTHVYRKQVSFSKLPVVNPHYMKHVEHEYNYNY